MVGVNGNLKRFLLEEAIFWGGVVFFRSQWGYESHDTKWMASFWLEGLGGFPAVIAAHQEQVFP